jgi:hypothetical protein
MTTSTDDNNPFQATDIALETQTQQRRVIHSPLVLSIQWTVVLLCNSVVPLLIGWTEVQQGLGQIGIVLGMFFGLLLGYLASIYTPLLVMYAIRGGMLVAFSQFFPVLQLLAGMLGIEFMRKTGIIPGKNLDIGNLGLVDAFLVTMATGSILVGISCLFGLLLRLVTPDRWWMAKRRAEE